MLFRQWASDLAGVIFLLGPILGVAGHAPFCYSRMLTFDRKVVETPHGLQNDRNGQFVKSISHFFFLSDLDLLFFR